MAILHRSAASLRIGGGDDLIPDELSKLLGASPTRSHRKGEVRQLPNGNSHAWHKGLWSLHATDRTPEDVDGQIAETLDQLTDDLDVWNLLGQRFEIDLFCGWFMKETNEGVGISPKTMAALAARGIELAMDIYAPRNDSPEPASS